MMKKTWGKLFTFGGIGTFLTTFIVVAKHQDAVYSSILSRRETPTFSPLTLWICQQQNTLLVISILLFVVGLILWISGRREGVD